MHSRRERRRGIDIMRAYAPVWTGLESWKLASGIVGVEAEAEFFQMTDRIRHGLALFGIASVILTFLAIAFAWRLLRRTVDIEETMERTTRAMALGRMTSTVAHEIRNPLGIISTNAQVLQKSEEPKIREIAEDILAQVNRSDRIIRRFLNLSDSAESQKTVLLNEIVHYSVEAVRKGIDPQLIQLTQESNLGNARIDCDPDRLHSVFVNILDNAVDAIRDSGNKGSITLYGTLLDNVADIFIIDTGPGMDAETLEHVKEPFYTKKATGTGLGLAIADRIVREHGGQLKIDSMPGKGTTITIRLPVKTANEESIGD